MDKSLLNNFETLGKAAFDCARELGEINTKIYEQLAAKQRDFMADVVDLGSSYFTNTGDVHGVEEVVNRNVEFATAYNDKFIAVVRETAEIVAASQGDFKAWFDKGVKVVNENTTAPFSVPTITTAKKSAAEKKAA